MIGDFVEQCRFDEDSGLLPKGYTDDIIKKMGVPNDKRIL